MAAAINHAAGELDRPAVDIGGSLHASSSHACTAARCCSSARHMAMATGRAQCNDIRPVLTRSGKDGIRDELAGIVAGEEPAQFPGSQLPSTVPISAPLPCRRISVADLTSA
ncbi:hypothetical protein A9K65_030770 [Mesorhizobium sp. WSM1497]|nr:hypothetical protein A9K65_030770 [Mesorhizobium sp. WSM1497]